MISRGDTVRIVGGIDVTYTVTDKSYHGSYGSVVEIEHPTTGELIWLPIDDVELHAESS